MARLKYEWKDSKLQKKSRLFNYVTIICLCAVLFLFIISPVTYGLGIILFGILAFVCLLMSLKLQAKDKKLKG